MNKSLQELILDLPSSDTMLLTVLLNEIVPENWEKNKHLIICSAPKLTLEMAINDIAHYKHNSIPSPKLIHDALKYARDLSSHHSRQNDLAMLANG